MKNKKKDIFDIEIALEQNVKLGLAVKVGKNKNGETLFRVTKKGIAYVEAMPFKNSVESAEWLKNYK